MRHTAYFTGTDPVSVPRQSSLTFGCSNGAEENVAVVSRNPDSVVVDRFVTHLLNTNNDLGMGFRNFTALHRKFVTALH